ncbi:MAG: cobyrinate a,c-diamide synthase [Deltaproteobacteria bacterium]|nr:cobyrinate a,c-diamide synthase [Deltaproteobacteria bacterium]
MASDRKIPAFVIAGTHSGSGKTTVSLGIMAALVKRGFVVQPFKVGPDFIDPGHHRRITGRDSHNLDGWIMSRERNQDIFDRYCLDADVAVVEGVMGLFDGFSSTGESGSTAQMAKWLGLPVILVIDARSMARSAAAVALGFCKFDAALPMGGILFNRVGSEVHAKILVDAINGISGPSVWGCLSRDEAIGIPSRHLGLVTEEDFSPDGDYGEHLVRWIENNMDLDRLLKSVPDVLLEVDNAPDEDVARGSDIRIGIAKDEAFCFYYSENLRLLREAGAELVPFSPLHARHLPEGIKGLILGGGYPELHCEVLSENRDLLAEIREFGLSGRPLYAECGGFMVLMEEIRDLKGRTFPMAGIFPMSARMGPRLKALGYRSIITQKESILGPANTRVRGHEFHYSMIEETEIDVECLYEMRDRKADSTGTEGFVRNRVLGSYVHLHWGSNSKVAKDFVAYCRRYG